MRVNSFLRYWLPVLIWLGVIFVGSSDLMSAEHTSRFIGPFLRWLIPDIAPASIAAVQLAVRKTAHLTEYAILAALMLRALRGEASRVRWPQGAMAFALAATFAAFDEYHQSFIASRTGSPFDAIIDATGAALGLVLYWIATRTTPKACVRATPKIRSSK